jgi:cell division protein ZapA
MAEDDGKTEVEIFGERYTLRSEDAPEHLQKVADYVDSKFRELMQLSPMIGPSKAAVLVSVNLADELFKQHEVTRRREGDMLARIDELVRLLHRDAVAG